MAENRCFWARLNQRNTLGNFRFFAKNRQICLGNRGVVLKTAPQSLWQGGGTKFFWSNFSPNPGFLGFLGSFEPKKKFEKKFRGRNFSLDLAVSGGRTHIFDRKSRFSRRTGGRFEASSSSFESSVSGDAFCVFVWPKRPRDCRVQAAFQNPRYLEGKTGFTVPGFV